MTIKIITSTPLQIRKVVFMENKKETGNLSLLSTDDIYLWYLKSLILWRHLATRKVLSIYHNLYNILPKHEKWKNQIKSYFKTSIWIINFAVNSLTLESKWNCESEQMPGL